MSSCASCKRTGCARATAPARRTLRWSRPTVRAQGPAAPNCADAMAQEIYANGPITGMFFVRQSFTSYKSGVYSSPGHGDQMLGGHAIKIIGFGVEDGVDYWLVANSW